MPSLFSSHPRLYWIDAPTVGRLAVVSRPRGPEDIVALRAGGLDVLVSMLEAEEAVGENLDLEADWCRQAGVEFISRPIVDHGIPETIEEIAEVSARLVGHLAAGRAVGAHCFAGLGRSPLMMACVLLDRGLDVDHACALISAARGANIPEMQGQRRWLETYARRRT